MRITLNAISENFLRDIQKNSSETAKLDSELSSGLRVQKPSQDPIAFQSDRIIKGNIQKNEQYQSNINSGLRQGRIAQQAIDGIVDNFVKIKEIMVKGANSSYGDSERETMADQISGLRKDIVDSLNQQYGNRYLFAGTKSGTQPFQISGSTVTNNSNNKAPNIIAGDGVKIDISITGKEVADVNGQDLFTLLGSMEQALRNNNTQNINNLIPKTDDIINHVSNLASKLGDNINRMNFMNQQYQSVEITQKANSSDLVDADYTEAYSKLQKNQIAYKSAMAVYSKMFENTLLKYL